MELFIYVDGSYFPSTGQAGVGIVLVYPYKTYVIGLPVDAESHHHAELLAAMIALRKLADKRGIVERHTVLLHSDSQYFVDRVQGRIRRREYRLTWNAYFSHARLHDVCVVQGNAKMDDMRTAHQYARIAAMR